MRFQQSNQTRWYLIHGCVINYTKVLIFFSLSAGVFQAVLNVLHNQCKFSLHIINCFYSMKFITKISKLNQDIIFQVGIQTTCCHDGVFFNKGVLLFYFSSIMNKTSDSCDMNNFNVYSKIPLINKLTRGHVVLRFSRVLFHIQQIINDL